jgi:competence ComEA-like helix-hairpin-helix protein
LVLQGHHLLSTRTSTLLNRLMIETTPQERTALLVLALLLMAGAAGRHAVHRADLRSRLQYSSESADTLNTGSRSPLMERVEQELERSRTRQTPLQPGEKLDPNQATADELARLPRIGPALAERIVAHRRSVGPFRTAADLRSVSGIGPAMLAAVEPHLDFSRAPPDVSRRSPRGSGSSPGAIDFNRASADELETISGIGPVIAGRIVHYRSENGPFRSFADLEKVAGIGARLRERLQSAGRIGP